MKRIMPPGNKLPIDGWLFNPKGMPKPLNCSWDDAELIHDEDGIIYCPDCDLYDRRKGA